MEYDAFASPGSNVSDDESAWSGDDADCVCVKCNKVFQLSAKGCSLFRRLCTSCHAEHKKNINEDAISSDDEDFASTTLVTGDTVVDTDSIDGSSDPTTVIGDDQETSKDKELVINNDNAASSTDIEIEQNDYDRNEETETVMEDEGKVEERVSGGGGGEVWSEEIMSAFLSKDISIQLDIAGFPQCFVMKKHKMDPPGTVLRFYADLELVDRCKPLYNYIVLSAHFNSSRKTLALARSIVVHNKTHAKYVVLAIFRTKCINPRYDPILMDVTTLAVFRLTGMANFRKDYTYKPDEPVDNKLSADVLVEWVDKNGLVHDPRIRPNKNEDGTTQEDNSWKSSYIDLSQHQRRSQRAPQPILHDDPPAVLTSKSKGRKKKGGQSETEVEPKKKTRRGKSNNKKKRSCQEVPTCDVDGFDNVVVEIEDDMDELDGATDNALLATQMKQLELQLKEKQAMKVKIFKLKQELQALNNTNSDDMEDNKPALPIQESQGSEPSSSFQHIPPAPLKRNATQMEEGNPSPPIMPKRTSRGLNYAQMMVVQNQATRIADSHHRLREAELRNAFYENMIMNGVNFKS